MRRLLTHLWFRFAPWLDWCREQLAATGGQYAQLPSHSYKLRRGSSRVTLRHFLIALPVVVLLVLLIARVDIVHAPIRPSSLAYCGQHPILRLTTDAQQSFAAVRARQSKTLAEAVSEYKRRYGMPPPPHFDKWYEFAQSRGTVLVDEYDSIYHSLLPFWALAPHTIRSRTREDIGFHDSQLMGVSIRQGQATHMENNGGQGDFQAKGTMDMIAPFAQWLPDMDIAFNTHDEPRVVLSRDELDKMVGIGREAQARLDRRGRYVDREFSPSHREFDGPVPPNPKSRFSNTDHQETWLWSRLSCPLDSPARRLDDDGHEDDELAPIYGDGPLGLVSNHTAFSDICQSPVLRHRLGFFILPNAAKITTQLTPVFSMSKPSTFQDIPYPSPFYHTHPTPFDENMSVEWDQMLPQMYWRGGTSGGYTEGGAWRTQLRQHVIAQLTKNAPNENQQLLLNRENPVPMSCKVRGLDSWRYHLDLNEPKRNLTSPQLQGKTNSTYSSQTLNVKFTLINQCAEADCDEELAFFGEAPPEPQDDAWRYRYLLDMDGNAYSGRFYAFMLSDSVPLKLAFFREWHADSLVPWVHYVPLGLQTRGYVELVRFFEEEEEGRIIAKRIAQEGRKWAESSLRNADMEVYMFRLLLEYGRVIDDKRDVLGFYR